MLLYESITPNAKTFACQNTQFKNHFTLTYSIIPLGRDPLFAMSSSKCLGLDDGEYQHNPIRGSSTLSTAGRHMLGAPGGDFDKYFCFCKKNLLVFAKFCITYTHAKKYLNPPSQGYPDSRLNRIIVLLKCGLIENRSN